MDSRRRRHSKTTSGPRHREMLWGVAILRMVVGLVFLVNGSAKLLFGGLTDTAATVAAAGLPMPGLLAGGVGVLEFVGGMLLTLGVLTRPLAAMLAVEMVLVILLIHLENGFFVADGGYEYPLVLLAALVAIAMAGRARP